jgi:penicillin-binding protein 1C
MLADNDARVRSFGSRSALRLPFPVAVKTGTSTDYRDNWTIGFTPQYTVAVWVGNFDGSPMRGVSGVTGAGPIFRDIFTYLDAQERQTWYPQPDQVEMAAVDDLTGYLIPQERPMKREPHEEKFHRNHLPGIAPAGQYDAAGRVLLPQAFAAWLESSDNWLGNVVAMAPENSPLNQVSAPLRMQIPLHGTTYLLDPDLTEQGQVLFLKANAPASELTWSSETLILSNQPQRPQVRLQPGDHTLKVESTRTKEVRTATIHVRRL